MPRITSIVYSYRLNVRALRPYILPVFDFLICFVFRKPAWSAIQDAIHSIVVSITDCNNDDLVTGHPPGGVAMFWCTHLDQNIKLIDIECDCYNTIQFNIRVNNVVIINCGKTQRLMSKFVFF